MKTSPIRKIFLALAAVGIVTFLVVLFTRHPERAWQAYLINFLVWSAIAQGGLLFSTVVSLVFLPTIYTGLDAMRSWPRNVYHFLARWIGLAGSWLVRPMRRLFVSLRPAQERR
jgi:formate hydrogenlyase subunit 3/multisubunit Na+/H+ antiporter MnhD subunit